MPPPPPPSPSPPEPSPPPPSPRPPTPSPQTELSLVATFRIAGTVESFDATNFTQQLAHTTGVTASAIALNILPGSLTVTASFYTLSASDCLRVHNTLDQQPAALSATLGATVLSTPTIRVVEPAPPPSVADSAAALLANDSTTYDSAFANDSASSSSLLTIAWIMAGAFAATCACVLLVYLVQRRRRKQKAKLKFGERRPRRKQDVKSGVEMTEDPQAIIAASEAACRERMRDHLDDYARAVGPANVNFKAWMALLHPENVTLDGRMWLEKGEQLTLWKQKFPHDLSAESEAHAARSASATRGTTVPPATPATTASLPASRLRATAANAEEHASLPVGSATLSAVPIESSDALARRIHDQPVQDTVRTQKEEVQHVRASREGATIVHEQPWGPSSRSEPGIGGPSPVVMPHLGEDLVGSMLPEAELANFYSEFEAQLDA